MVTFQDLGLREEVLRGIEELGFQSPTPVQEKVVAHLLQTPGDIIALAQTGTGKTAAFGLPVIQEVDTTLDKIQALMIAPTRELCVQISVELKNYSKHVKGLRVVPVYGGESIEKQLRSLDKTPHILVATPGRLTDFIKRKRVNLSNVEWLVLDEADEMLDMGFEEDISYIIGQTPENRKTLLFSATMSREVMAVAHTYMNDPTEISVGKKNTGTSNVSHHYYLIEAKNRYNALKRLADLYPDVYGIVFCRTRKETQEVADNLTRDGYNADALHGDLSQAQRDFVMKKFRDRNLNLLVATDVAARGLDVNSLTHVINYNLPDDMETYTHRSGRTGRANNIGISIALVTRSERDRIGRIEKKLQRSFEHKQLPNGNQVLENQILSFISKIENAEVNDQQLEPLMDEIYEKLEYMDKKQLIRHFVSNEINRFLTYYENAPDLNVADRSDRRSDRDRDRGRGDRESRDNGRGGPKMRLELNMGLKDGINPGRLLGMVNEAFGNSSLNVGRIDIQGNSTVFEVDEKDGEKLVSVFGKKFQSKNLFLQQTTAAYQKRERKESFSRGGGSSRNTGGGSGRSGGGFSRKRRY